MKTQRSQAAVKRALILVSVGVVVLAGLPAGAASQEVPACLDVIPTSELDEGDVGYGVTVARGSEREQFVVKILGVLEDAIGPGRDLIIVEVSGTPIDRVGGIWYGISGSPIYIDNKLAGSVSYGLSFGPSHIAGVTPAEDIARIWSYPIAENEVGGRAQMGRVRLSDRDRARLAAATNSDTEDIGGSFRPLRIPVSISGLPDRALQTISEVFKREHLPFIPFAGGAASGDGSATTPVDIQPGDNFVAALSYGDLTFAGLGTATLVCEGRIIAFGHPFFWEGPTTFGANTSETITVVEDPVFGPYELGTIGPSFGRIDQDRLAGIRALTGEAPASVPITSTVSSVDTNYSREGQTTVLLEEEVPFFAFYHLYANILVVMDMYGPGTSSVSFTVNGTRENGDPWTLTRDNIFASEYGIADASAYELENILYTLLYNDFEEVHFDSISMTASTEEELRQYEITQTLVSTDGVNFEERRRLRVHRGSPIFVRVMLTPSDESPDVPVDLEVRVPRRARTDGILEISGLRSFFDDVCFYEPEECRSDADKIDSFDELLEKLANRPKNNQLNANLKIGGNLAVRSSDSEILDRVVSGFKRIRLIMAGGTSGGGVSEPKGRYSAP